MRLDGKVTIVTGAASGIGAGVAAAFVAEGARTVLADIDGAGAAAGAAALGPLARSVQLDVTNEASWAAAVDFVRAEFGPPTVLANVAGVGDGGALADTTLAGWNRVIEVNQTGVFLGMRTVVGSMREAGGGSIINVSSTEGLQGGAYQLAYVASKFAVRGMSKAAALELGAEGIRVNSIHPGAIDTPMLAKTKELGIDMGEVIKKLAVIPRLGRPDEVGALATFLASDESSYCTGAEFVIDGGLTAGYRSDLFFGGVSPI